MGRGEKEVRMRGRVKKGERECKRGEREGERGKRGGRVGR